MQKVNEKNQVEQQGLVISYFGSSVAVEADDGQVFQCHLRRNQELPVVGDHVEWHIESEDKGLISAIKPRYSLLARGDHHGKMKAIAANVDVIVIVMAPAPIFSEYLIDRYLVAAELLNIAPIVVLNKIDLLSGATREMALQQLDIYKKIPYPVILSSIYLPDGLQSLGDILKNKTSVLVGPSGVGKSSIIAALIGDESVRVADVSPKGAGKHTTTATRLYHLPKGGDLIDSPGVREFNLWPITKQELLRGFKEFKDFTSGCKFRDCQHLVEPGCTVQAAVASDKISQKRYENYQTLMKEAHANTMNTYKN